MQKVIVITDPPYGISLVNKGTAMMDRVIAGRDTKDLEILCRVCNAVDFLERKNNKQSKRFKIIWS